MKRLRQIFTFKRILLASVVMFVVWLLVFLLLATTAHFYGQQNQPQKADVIIVLGAGLRRDNSAGDALRRRSIWAAQLWEQDYAPYILCTGGVSYGKTRSEADGCREVLIDNGVPSTAIYLEEQSRSTEENAINTRLIMQDNAWDDALLVTDSFHMFRADWIFNDYGIAHYSAPVPANWIRTHWYLLFLARESIALQWQGFKDVLNLPVTYVPIG